jgi:hypothetical protein
MDQAHGFDSQQQSGRASAVAHAVAVMGVVAAVISIAAPCSANWVVGSPKKSVSFPVEKG